MTRTFLRTLSGARLRNGLAVLLLVAAPALFAVSCGDDNDNDGGGLNVQTALQGEEQNAPNQNDVGDRTQIPGQGTGGGAGAGGGVPQGNATVPATLTPSGGPAGTTAPGSSPASPSEREALISDLSAGFQGHVYLVGIMAEAVKDGDEARETAIMSVLTDDDTRALAQSMGLLGADVPAFINLWNSHLQLYRQYMDAKKAGDNAGASDARTKLQDFPGQFVDFAKGFAPAVGVDTTGVDALNQHVNTTLSVIDSTLTNQPAAPQQLRDGARAMADFAKLMMGVK